MFCWIHMFGLKNSSIPCSHTVHFPNVGGIRDYIIIIIIIMIHPTAQIHDN